MLLTCDAPDMRCACRSNAAHLAAARGHVGVLALLLGEEDAGERGGGRAGDGAEEDGPVGVGNITCQEHHTRADDVAEDDGGADAIGPAGVRNITRQEHHTAGGPDGGADAQQPGARLSLTARDLSKWSVLHHAAFHGQVMLLRCDAPEM